METDSDIREKNENDGKKLVITSQRNNSLNNSNTLDEIEIALYSGMQTKTQHEEPIDLTFSQKQIKQIDLGKNLITANQQEINFEKSNFLSTTNQLLFTPSSVPKKRGRKRKDTTAPPVKEEKLIPNIKFIYHMNNYNNQEESGHSMDNRHTEVLMAAKSLFSKRTRTLYHWMYPNTPKAQLKSAVSMSWETLGIQEKEFYISQVLGRFGFPQSSLMVNPQLGGLRASSTGVPPLDLSSPTQINLETRNAVSTILDSPNENQNENEIKNWPSHGININQVKKNNNKKRGRIGRPTGKIVKTKLLNVNRSVNVENINEEFQDDPELRKEFEQFKWALHMSDKKN
nr:uncharacterized protein LOC111428124 isoform X1 [Onthophagus taurus]